MVLPPRSDSTPLGGAAAVVRDGRDVGDRADFETRCLERADRLLAAGARSLDVDLDLAHPVLHRPAGGALSRERGRIGRALAGALEAGHAGRAPADHGTRKIRDRDDRVVERRLDVDVPLRDVLAFPAALLYRPLALGHASPSTSGPTSCAARRPSSSVRAAGEHWPWFAGHAPAGCADDASRGTSRSRSAA